MKKEISDHRLAYWFQQQLSHKIDAREPLKHLRLCGSRIIPKNVNTNAVFLMANNSDSRFFGTTACHSVWACPNCTAKVMAKYGGRIATAIDALAKKQKQFAFMCTLTIPHTKSMSCEETFQILLKTWRRFARRSTKKQKKYYTTKDNERKLYIVGNNAFGAFKEELEIKHHIRIYEFTWGENAWHAHIHALFWVPEKNWNLIQNYEQSLLDSWWHCAKQETQKFYSNKTDKQTAAEIANALYTDWRKYPKTGHRSVWFSKDKNGSIRKQESSYYITGWSGDIEVTAHHKNAAEGHYSTHQIIEQAYKLKGTEEGTKFLNLYIEYAKATKKHIRVQWSKSNINQIIEEWKKSNEYYETLKKKFMDVAEAKKWRVVCWFNSQQWYQISYSDRYNNTNIKAVILELALQKNAKQKISQFLEQYHIKLNQNKHPDEWIIENRILISPLANTYSNAAC